jgi:hypothetical protein
VAVRADAVASGLVPGTSAIRGDGRYDFALQTASGDRAVYAAREAGATGPQLILGVE